MTRLAAVDCGTNATRILIADVVPQGRMREVTRQLVITRMGAGLGDTGAIGDAGLGRVAATLGRYADLCEHFDVERVAVLATSAAREATNTADLVGIVVRTLGVVPAVLSGDEEAAATYRGATAGLVAAAPPVVVDLGGGSTEFAMDTGGSVRTRSLPLGSVRLLERHLTGGQPAADEDVAAAVAAVDQTLTDIGPQLPVAEAASVVAVGGTALTLAALEAGLDDPDDRRLHGSWLARADVDRFAMQLLSTPVEDLARRAVITPGREDVIGPGALILSRVLARVDASGMVVSRHDLLDDAVRRLAADAAPTASPAGA